MPGQLSTVVVIRKWAAAAALMMGFCLTGGATPRPDLTGNIELPDGQPAQATILIDTAKPRTGSSTFCPSCYADCRKKAKTDTNGDFKIESLDPDLIFRVLIIGEGCKAQFVNNVDPASHPLIAVLEKQDNSKVPPENSIRGRVLDTNGAPLAQAEVEAFGIHQKDGGGMWGTLSGVDPLTVTDDRGEFILTSSKPFASLDVKVSARGFAKKTFTELKSGGARHDLTVTEGATVTGRVLWNGKPLPGVSVGIVSVDRGMENFTGDYEIGTGADGHFAFINLPPNVTYSLYGITESFKKYGATTLMTVSAGGDGSTTDAGDLKVAAGHRLAGRVVLSDGKPVPGNTRLLIGRNDAWDSLQLILDKDGGFTATNLPSGAVDLSVRVAGYHFSPKNASLDPLNPRIAGRLDADVTNLTLLLEKGPEPERDFGFISGEDRPENRPLGGVEAGAHPAGAVGESWQLSGQVTDAKTGKPIASFQVTPGVQRYQQINFNARGQVDGSNGVYALALSKRLSQPMLKVEALGYIPVAVTPPLADSAHFNITLEPGSGPSGTVLLHDGTPAVGVTVGLICAGQQGMSVRDNKIETWRKKNLVQSTDASGHFAFLPELRMENVAAVSEAGFKLVTLSELAANPKMTLEPWGRVKGILRRPGGPGANEDLDLTFAPEVLESQWSFQTGNHTETDDHGAFEFDQVPPSAMVLSYRVKMSQNGWRTVPLQTLTIAPGQTLETNIDAPKREEADRTMMMPQPTLARRIGPDITGTVTLPDGKPAAGAQVALIVSNVYFALGKATFHLDQDPRLKTLTDGTGHFSLPGVEGLMGIAAVNDTGFARIAPPTPGSAPVLALQAWGEIHGTLRVGKRLGSNEAVSLTTAGGGGLMYDFQEFKTTTDDQGRFVITYVPPGEQYLARRIPMGGGSWTQGNLTPVTVKPGGVTEVAFGGTGREVTGKARFQNPADAVPWEQVLFSLHEPFSFKPGQAARPRPRIYSSEYTANGGFTFEDVLPGKYTLTARLKQNQSFGRARAMTVMPLANKELTIPKAGGVDSKPFDAGTLDLQVTHPLQVGDKAADFEVETIDGKKLRLADFRGKYVLLNFFFARMTTPEAMTPLRDAFHSYGKDKRFAMLGISFAPAAIIKEYARTSDIQWPLGASTGMLGSTDISIYLQTDASWNDGVTYLIDPDGKIAGKSLSGDEIKSSLAKVLATR